MKVTQIRFDPRSELYRLAPFMAASTYDLLLLTVAELHLLLFFVEYV